jgi:DNA-binding response OmpR family regulator
VSNLRRKLKNAAQNPNILVNVRGIGYRLNDVELS